MDTSVMCVGDATLARQHTSDYDSSNIRVVHGGNEGYYPLRGKTVGVVRLALREIFHIAPDAVASLDGEYAPAERVIADERVLEFVKENGTKGLGALLTPDELKAHWRISGEEYEELLIFGLPFVRFGSGSVRHPETSVDEFFKQLGDSHRSKPPELVGTRYVAERLGCTTVWVTQLIRSGEIPPSCIAPGTGNGRLWKFIRVRIDEWLKRR